MIRRTVLETSTKILSNSSYFMIWEQTMPTEINWLASLHWIFRVNRSYALHNTICVDIFFICLVIQYLINAFNWIFKSLRHYTARSLRISDCPKRNQVTERSWSSWTLNEHTTATTYSISDCTASWRTSVCHLHFMVY